MDELLVKVLLMVRDSSCFCLSHFLFVCFLKYEVRVDSSGTTETDRYCSDMDFLY